jgi:chorismate mutase-like protein
MNQDDGLRKLRQCRDRIDELDRRILDLINRRTRVVEEIGRIKQGLRLPIYEPQREDEVYQNVTENNRGPLPADAVRRVFERIIDEMRTVQKIRMEQQAAAEAARRKE